MRPVTKSEFAKERQVSRARVYQWLDDGRIQALEDGRIDADEANRVLDDLLDRAKGMRREGNITSAAPASSVGAGTGAEAADGQRNAAELPLAGSEAPAPAPKARENDAYWSHKTESEKYDALQKRARFLQTAGALVPAEEVRRERIETARTVKNALLAMVDRVAPVLDPANPSRAHKLLTSEVQKALNGLRSDLEQRAAGAAAVPGEPTAALQ